MSLADIIEKGNWRRIKPGVPVFDKTRSYNTKRFLVVNGKRYPIKILSTELRKNTCTTLYEPL